MVLQFKALITPNGEFGLLDMEIDPNGRLFIATSMTPTLLQPTATLEMLKKNYNGIMLSHWDMDIPDGKLRYDFDVHTPDWKLIDIEVNY